MSNNAYAIKSGENVVLVLGCTTNSLYCQSFKISYVDAGSPSSSQYSYTLTTVGSGTTTFKDASNNTIAPNQKVNSGTKLTPTFTPNPGYEFTSWEYYTTVGTWSNVSGTNFTISKDVQFRVTYSAIKPSPTLSFAEATYNATKGEEFTAPTVTTDPAGLTVTYSSSKPEVATVDEETGAVALIAAGTTMITATFDGDATYKSASTSYDLVVAGTKYAVSIVAPENGTLTIKDGETVINSGDQVEEGKTLTVIATPADGYRFKNWGYKDGEANWVGNLTSTFTHVMPSAACSFKATFEAIQYYSINYMVNGTNTNAQVNVEEGTTLVFPTPTTINGKVFRGWIETAAVANPAVEPTYVTTSGLKATSNKTYYAVFADAEGTGAPVDKTITLDFVGDDWGIPVGSSAKLVEETAYSYGGYTIKLAGNTGNGFYMGTSNSTPVVLMLGKTDAYLKLPVLSTPIKKITCLKTPNSSVANSVKWNVYAGENAASTEVTGCANGAVFVIADAYQNSELMIKVTNSYNTQFTGVEILTETPGYTYSNFTTTVPTIYTTNTLGYGTFSSAYQVKVEGEGVNVYTATIDAETKAIVCHKVNSGIVPAGTGVLVYGTASANWTATPNAESLEDGEEDLYTANELLPMTLDNGALAAVPATNGTSTYVFILSGSNFKKYTGTTFVHNKAYFNLDFDPTASGAPMRIVFATNGTDTATAIDAVENGVTVEKIMENGQLIIIKNGIRYNVQGMMIK